MFELKNGDVERKLEIEGNNCTFVDLGICIFCDGQSYDHGCTVCDGDSGDFI